MALITFRFEGLSCFVVRRNSTDPKKPNGVYSLMPRTNAPPHYGTIKVGSYSGTLSGDINIRDVPNQPIAAGSAPRIGHLLPLTRVNKVRLDEDFLTGKYENRVAALLEARIVLPLHRLVAFVNDVLVQWDEASSTWVDIGSITGVTELTYDVSGPVTIPTVPMPVTEPLVVFSYSPNPIHTANHARHVRLQHADAYAPIFHGKKPRFRTAVPYDGTRIKPQVSILKGVDPVICSQAGGCDPDDLQCEDCSPLDPNCGEG